MLGWPALLVCPLTGLLSGVQDVSVLGALDHLLAGGGLQGDLQVRSEGEKGKRS